MDRIGGFESLFEDINKTKGGSSETSQGKVSAVHDELSLEMDDQKLLEMAENWQKSWANVETELERKRKENENYYLGKVAGLTNFQNSEENVKGRPFVDNIIYEAVETFLPMATKKNPDPDVSSDGTEQGYRLAYNVQKMLSVLADRLGLKLTLKQMTRHWLMYFLGAVKMGWNEMTNEIEARAVRPTKLILDADSTVDRGEYTGEYIGEYREDTASRLIARFPEKEEAIMEEAKKLGTKLRYIEWWTNDIVFWTLKKHVLGKAKNPHWNYDSETQSVDEFGNPVVVPVPGVNHFRNPKMPYVLLSVFNLGQRPFDDTGLVEQNLSAQDRVIKRLKQIDRNVDSMNGSIAVSGSHFSEEQAATADEMVRKGATVWVPKGEVGAAIAHVGAPGLPSDVYQDLADIRRELKSNFGILGSTAGGIQEEKTVRGKLIVKSQDGDRIGGGFTEYLEKSAEKIYGWMVQLACVYYDEPRYAEVIGDQRAKEMISLKSSDFGPPLTITVKEGSLVPQDTMSRRNEALELWAANGLDPISFYTALEMPNPREMAKSLFLWQTNPSALFPELAPPMPSLDPMTGQPIATAQPPTEEGPPPDPSQGGLPSPEALGMGPVPAVS